MQPTSPHLLSAKDVLKQLQIHPDTGVVKHDITKRRQQYGANEIPQERRGRLLTMFLDRFRDVLVLILVAAAVVSFALGNIEDTIIIAIAIAIDSSLSFLQVWRTERTLEQMREHVKDVITVIRDGKTRTIPSSQLVVGDIMELRAGEKVPADARLIHVQGLYTQESVLTGESSDIRKQTSALSSKTQVANQSNMVFAGTTIVNGSGHAVITSVGTQTEFGKIAQILREQRSPQSPLRRKLTKTGIQIGWGIIGAVLVLSLISILQGQDIYTTARTSITLIVSAIPEDLTMILTIALTVGVTRILRKGGVVRKLGSGETLGAATIICTDKTGTLTEGQMTALTLDFMQGDHMLPNTKPTHLLQELAVIGLALANDAHKGGENGDEYFGSATERTSLAFAESVGFEQRQLRSQWVLRDAITFNPRWKYRAVLVDHPAKPTQFLFASGAPDVLLEKSSHALNAEEEIVSISTKSRHRLNKKIERLAEEGQRLLAVAVRRHLTQSEITRDDVHSLLFLGVLVIQDPVRPKVHQAIRQTQSAGVDVKLITGDHAATARAVARQVGLSATPDAMCSRGMLQEMSDEELKQRIDSITIFSRVEPLDKQRLIRILQEKGHVVAMTGDGINDTVALKSADIGVAMGSGMDIAKDAADLVLLNNSFETIVAAIREGRVIRDNIRKVITFLLATNTAEVAIFFVSVFMGMPLPLLPAQILWINLVTDGTSDIALALEPAEDDVMRRPPEHPHAPLFNRNLLMQIAFSGVVMTVGTMLLFWYLHTFIQESLLYARTMAFTFLSVSSLLSVWSFRSLTNAISTRGIWQNRWVPLSAGFSLALHMLAIYVPGFRSFFHTVPLGIADWLLIGICALLTVTIIDMRKMFLAADVPHSKAVHLSLPLASSRSVSLRLAARDLAKP